MLRELQQARTETEGAEEAEPIPGQWQELLQRYRQLQQTVNSQLAYLRTSLKDKKSSSEDYRRELEKRQLEECQYADVRYSEDRENAARNAERDLRNRLNAAQTQNTKLQRKLGGAETELEDVQRRLTAYGEPLERSQIGINFEQRIRSVQLEVAQIKKQIKDAERLEVRIENVSDKLKTNLAEYARPVRVPAIAFQEDFAAQCNARLNELRESEAELLAAEKRVMKELNVQQEQFHDSTCGVLNCIVSMIDLLEKKTK